MQSNVKGFFKSVLFHAIIWGLFLYSFLISFYEEYSPNLDFYFFS